MPALVLLVTKRNQAKDHSEQVAIMAMAGCIHTVSNQLASAEKGLG